jgi:tetratricopeptide (TPR) repeat protein
LYRSALAIEETNIQAKIGLAVALANWAGNGLSRDRNEQTQQLDEARALATFARERTPNDPRPYAVLSVWAAANGDPEGARRANETALSLDPKSPSRYANLADDYLDLGQPQQAIDLLEKAVRLDPRRPSWVTLVNMGRAQFMKGDIPTSIDWLLRSVDFQPSVSAHTYLAAAYALSGNMDRAKASANAVLRLNPGFHLQTFEPPKDGYPTIYRNFWQDKLLPACRLAGLAG